MTEKSRSGMSVKPRQWVLAPLGVFLLIASGWIAAVPQSSATQASADPWWNEAWHFRVPIEVKMKIVSPLTGASMEEIGTNYPVEIEADFTSYLSQVFPIGRLTATLDENSVRIVEYVKYSDGSTEMNVLRTLYSPGVWFEKAATFIYSSKVTPKTSTYGTVSWLMPGITKAGEERNFYLYFDLIELGEKNPQNYAAGDAARLEGRYWEQAAHVIFGNFVDREGYGRGSTTLRIYGTQADTRFQIYDLETNSPWFDAPQLLGKGEMFRTNAIGDSEYFKILADRPVLAWLGTQQEKGQGPTYFIPSADNGMRGTQFYIEVMGLPMGVYAITGSSPTTITTYYTDGTEHKRMNIAANSYVDIVGSLYSTGVYGATRAAVPSLRSSAPILVEYLGSAASLQMPGIQGNPVAYTHVGAYPFQSQQSTGQKEEAWFFSMQDGITNMYSHPLSGDKGYFWKTLLLQDGFRNNQRYYEVPPKMIRSEATAKSILYTSSRGNPDGFPEGSVLSLGGGLSNRHFMFRESPTPTCNCYGAVLIPYFDSTSVTIRQISGSDTNGNIVEKTVSIDAGKVLPLDRPWTTEVITTKPVTIQFNDDPHSSHTSGNWGSYLSGRLLKPEIEIGQAQFTGCLPLLVGLEPGNEAPPVVHAVDPGESTAFQLGVKNTAIELPNESNAKRGMKSVDGAQGNEATDNSDSHYNLTMVDPDRERFNFTDYYDVNLTYDITEAQKLGWTVNWSADVASVPPGAPVYPFAVSVVTTNTSKANTTMTVTVTAACVEFKDFRATFDVVTTIRDLHGVALRLVNPIDRIHQVKTDEIIRVPLRVTSLSNLPEHVVFNLSNPLMDYGWYAHIDLNETDLAAHQSKEFNLTVRAPLQDTTNAAVMRVRAQLVSDREARDEVRLEFRMRPHYDIKIDIDPPSQTVDPDTNATYKVSLTNTGNTRIPVRFALKGFMPLAWERLPETSLNVVLSPGQVFNRPVSVYVPKNASSDDIVVTQTHAALVNLTADGYTPSIEKDFVTKVTQRFKASLNATTPLAQVNETHEARYVIHVTNDGNGNDTFQFASHLPAPSWVIGVNTPTGFVPIDQYSLRIAPHESRDVELVIITPSTYPAGIYEVEIDALSQAGNGPGGNAKFQVQIPSIFEFQADPISNRASGLPGEPRTFHLILANTGNAPDEYTLELQKQDWEMDADPAEIELDPGARVVVDVKVTPLTSAAKMLNATQMNLVVASKNAGQKVVPLFVETQQPDLWIAGVEQQATAKGASPTMVSLKVTLVNKGTGMANGVRLQAQVDGKEVGLPVQIERIPPGERRDVTLPLSTTAYKNGEHDVFLSVAQADNTVPELRTDNNAYHFPLMVRGSSDTPGAATPLMFLALCVAALCVSGGLRRPW